MNFKGQVLFCIALLAGACSGPVCGFWSLTNPSRKPALSTPKKNWGLADLCYGGPQQTRMKESKSEELSEDDKKLTPELVAEMVEVSFVNGIMQLSQGYIDVLKLFIAAVASGYSLGMSPDTLLEAVAACPNQSANRPLMEEEIQLRSTWMQVIYLMLSHVKYKEKTLEDVGELTLDVESIQRYQVAIPLLVESKAKGESFEAETLLQKCAGVFPATSNALEQAIISQSLRVMWLTLTVLEEEKICEEDRKPYKPQPPIPGAFK